MARKTPKSRHQPATARSVGRTGAPSAGAAASGRSAPITTAADLEANYPVVRRDLVRIATLAAAMFALILLSPLFLK
jgi:hypothetical protein